MSAKNRYRKSSISRFIAIAVFSLMLSACSGGFFYNRLNILVPWYVDGYVDLSKSQRQRLKQDLKPLLAWHKESELSKYALFLTGVETSLDDQLSQQDVLGWMEFALGAYRQLASRSTPVLIELASRLSPEQTAQFLEEMATRQIEQEKEALDRDRQEYDQQTYDGMEEALEYWMGRLSPPQEEVIRDSARALQRYDEDWLAERQRWIDQLAKWLGERPPGWLAALEQGLEDRGDYHNRPYRDAASHNQRVLASAVAEIINLRGKRQDLRLRAELAKWRKRLVKLAEAG
jgi:hypothetical protein